MPTSLITLTLYHHCQKISQSGNVSVELYLQANVNMCQQLLHITETTGASCVWEAKGFDSDELHFIDDVIHSVEFTCHMHQL